MATIIPSNSQPVSFPQNPAPPMGPDEAKFAPTYGVTGPGDGVEARTQQLSLLVEVNAALAGALDVESVLGAILSRLADRERLSHARIYRLDEPAGELQQVACGGRNGGSGRVVSLQEPTLLAWAIRQREAVYVPRVEKDPRCQGFGAEEQCVYAVPLQTSTSVLGVLDVAADQPDSIRSVLISSNVVPVKERCNDINNLFKFFADNGLTINYNKCSYLYLGYKAIDKDQVVNMYSQFSQILSTKTVKDLGFIINDNITWNENFKSVQLKILKAFFYCRRNFYHASPVTKKLIYNTLILPIYKYTAIIINYNRTNTKTAERIQHRIINWISGYIDIQNYKAQLMSLEMLPLCLNCEIDKLCLINKIINNNIKIKDSSFLTKNTSKVILLGM